MGLFWFGCFGFWFGFWFGLCGGFGLEKVQADFIEMSSDAGFRISYHRLSDYPHALEEITLVRVNSRYLLGTGGFNTGAPTGLYSAKDIYKNRLKKGKAVGAKKYRRGFSNTACVYDIQENKWISVPKFPGCPRQGSRGVCLDGIAGCSNMAWVGGGFSYVPAPAKINKMASGKWPVKTLFQTYSDSYLFILNEENVAKSTWKQVCDLPMNWSNFCCGVEGDSLWVGIGGTHLTHMYTGKIDVMDERGSVLGQDMYQISVSDLIGDLSGEYERERWKKVGLFPGTPRLNAASVIRDGKWYILGGISPNFDWAYARRFEVDRYYSVLDNWVYDFSNRTWKELAVNPYPNGNFGSQELNLWRDRYMILLGGGYFKSSKYKGDVLKSVPYPPMEISRKKKEIVEDELKMRILLIYDIVADKWIEDYENFRLFNWTNLPSYVILGDSILLLAGEQIPIVIDERIYGLHSDLFLRADLKI